MNSTTIFEYIQELEKRNEESRTKIEQLKELYKRSEEERVATLEKFNKPSLFETTARTKTHTLNKDIAEHLKELGEMTADFYKAAAYNTAADVIATLDFEVHNGESLLEIKGIGKGIASKVDQFLDEYFDDSESVASTEGQILEESDDETDSDEEFFISYNSELADVFDELAYHEKDEHKSKAYDNAALIIDRLPFKVTSGKELAKGPKKVAGIGKSKRASPMSSMSSSRLGRCKSLRGSKMVPLPTRKLCGLLVIMLTTSKTPSRFVRTRTPLKSSATWTMK